VKSFIAVTVAVLVAIAVGIGLVEGLPATQQAVAPQLTIRACASDLFAAGRYVAMPKPVRIRRPLTVEDIDLLPPPASFHARVPASEAWRQQWHGGPLMEPTATYRLYLAVVVGASTPDSGRVDWVVVGTNIAYFPDGGPGAMTTRPTCVFGTAYGVIDATTGRALAIGG
jgi:hypothetical protein